VHAQALVEDVVVAPIIVIIGRRVVLRRPGAAVLAVPLAWAGVVLASSSGLT
jgi:hypothetical protein